MSGIDLDDCMPSNLISDIVKVTGDKYRCVDIGFVVIADTKRWVMIEVNPPFSLDDYNITLKKYMDFCVDACLWINKNIAR